MLVHGWPWSSFSWRRVIPPLAERFSLYWYDMPGYGQSEKSASQPTGLDVQGEIFVELLSHWRLQRPSVLAHDFGGALTLRAHLLHGCDFDRYVLMNVVAMRPWGSAFFDHVAKYVDAFQGLPAHIHRALVEAYMKGAMISDIPAEDIEGLVAPWLTTEGAASFYRQFAAADEKFTAEIESLYGNIRAPLKIIWGADDPWIPLSRGRALAALTPKGPFEVLPGVGHLPQLEAPDRVVKALLSIL